MELNRTVIQHTIIDRKSDVADDSVKSDVLLIWKPLRDVELRNERCFGKYDRKRHKLLLVLQTRALVTAYQNSSGLNGQHELRLKTLLRMWTFPVMKEATMKSFVIGQNPTKSMSFFSCIVDYLRC